MPSLMRFLTVVGLLVGLAFAAVYSLATFVTPRPREMTVSIPATRLRPPPPVEAEANPKTAGAEAPSAAPSAAPAR